MAHLKSTTSSSHTAKSKVVPLTTAAPPPALPASSRHPGQALAAAILQHDPGVLVPTTHGYTIDVDRWCGAAAAVTYAAWRGDTPWVWAGRCYAPGKDLLLAAALATVLAVSPTATAAAHRADALYRALTIELRAAAPPDPLSQAAVWDARPCLPVANGTLDLSDPAHPRLLPVWDPAHRMTYAAEAAWDPAAADPTVIRFVEDVLPDPDHREAVLEFLGLTLARWDRRGQAILFLVGTGSNGKSTFLRAVQSLIPRHFSSTSLQRLVSDQFAGSGLVNALINMVGDDSAGFLKDTSILKSLSGGDPTIVEAKYRDAYVHTQRVRLVFALNALPRTADHTHGWYRRALIARFPHVFQPGQLDTEALVTEAARSTWLRLLVEAYARFAARGDFDWTAQSIADERAAYRTDADPVARALAEDVLRFDQTGAVTPSQMQTLIRDYARAIGQEVPREGEVLRRLADLAAARGLPAPVRRRIRVAGRPTWALVGIRPGLGAWTTVVPRPGADGVALTALAVLSGFGPTPPADLEPAEEPTETAPVGIADPDADRDDDAEEPVPDPTEWALAEAEKVF